MSDQVDVVVLGLGVHGMSTLWQLSKRGLKVIGLESEEIAHTKGSSHGDGRITRLAYAEEERYVPLLQRSFDMYTELEKETGQSLFYQCGHVDIRNSSTKEFQMAVRACVNHNLPHQVMRADELSQRFPAFAIPTDLHHKSPSSAAMTHPSSPFSAIFNPHGGYLRAERMLRGMKKLAIANGASVIETCRVTEVLVFPGSDGVRVTGVTTDGKSVIVAARHVVLTAGAQLGSVIRRCVKVASSSTDFAPQPLPQSSRLVQIAEKLRVQRQVVAWFEVDEQHRHRHRSQHQPHAPPEERCGPLSALPCTQSPVWILTAETLHHYPDRIAPVEAIVSPQLFPSLVCSASSRSAMSNRRIFSSYIYGFPMLPDDESPDGEIDLRNTVKIGRYYHFDEILDDDAIQSAERYRVTDDDIRLIAEDVYHMVPTALSFDQSTTSSSRVLPSLPRVRHAVSCLFTMTPDEHFIIDSAVEPGLENVTVCSGCSGHGFKFTAIGWFQCLHLGQTHIKHFQAKPLQIFAQKPSATKFQSDLTQYAGSLQAASSQMRNCDCGLAFQTSYYLRRLGDSG